MKRKLLLACLLAGSALFARAQTQLVNGDMELWDNPSTANQEPQQWNSFKTANCSLGALCGTAQAQRIERSTDIRPGSTGTYSARIYSTSVIGIIANGNVTTGQIQMGSSTASNSANHNKTLTANSAHRMPITALPDSIIFWAKYQPSSNSTTEEARMRAVLHDNYDYRDPSASDPNSPSHIVAEATQNFTRTYSGSSYVWKRFAVPFTYTGPSTTPTYMLVTFTTNKTPGGGANNDQVWIDDIELKYNPVTTTVSALSPLNYNVSATVGASISIPFTKTGNLLAANVFTAQLSDASGSFASPITLGTLASASAGTITGTIPAGTPSGTGYRVRVVPSVTYQTANANTDDISINLVNNSIAPTATQTIAADINGNPLTVTETITATSREWKYATISGGPYSSFGTVETGTTYTPNFSAAGTYYIVCETTVGSITTRSNQVTVNVVDNLVTPAGSQSLLTGNPGSILTVTEMPSAASSREWKYSTTSGSGYVSFGTPQTATTYTPFFNTAGTYYVICQSVISGVTVISNEVIISVGSLSISTGTISGSPFEFSPSAPDANVTVPFTVSGAFSGGNTFTAQLSDASGSFATVTNIGSVSGTASGNINAVIPSNTPQGNGYLIRVIGSNPVVAGSDNGTALTVDQFSNSILPTAPQTFIYTASGTALTVSESQSATREWRVSTTAGGPYTAITPAQTGTSYVPSFNSIGTFYVVSASENQYGDEVISNEVMITTTNGNTINTSAINGSPFYVSPSANNQVTVNFTSDVIFNSGNVFTAQLSNANGSFATPVSIGTLTATSPSAISATIPNVILDGTGYRIRVVSSDPAIIGTDNGTNLSMVNFNINFSSLDTQFVSIGEQTAPVSLQSTHPNPTVEWKVRTSILANYLPFSPPATGVTFVHTFNSANTYQVIATAVNSWGDTLTTPINLAFVVSDNLGIDEQNEDLVKAFASNSQFIVDLTNSTFENPQIQLVDMTGKVVYNGQLQGKATHIVSLNLASGVYTYRISEKGKTATGKIPVF